MIRELDESSVHLASECDVIIIGSGLAGLTIANFLTKRGKRVAVLESGGQHAREDEPRNSVVFSEARYSGASDGRFRCLGGTSTRWGGALLPYLPEDITSHACGWHEGWVVSHEDMMKELGAIEQIFAINHEGYEADQRTPFLPGFVARRPKWPDFGKRNIANCLKNEIIGDDLIILLDASVVGMEVEDETVVAARCRNSSGDEFRIDGKSVVIAAGAIETTRLLLLEDLAEGGRLTRSGMPLGQGFHDHLSAPIAELEIRDRQGIIDLFTFKFEKNQMRNLRYERPASDSQDCLPASFMHVAFERKEENAFEALREIYQALQRRQWPTPRQLSRLFSDIPWLISAASYRVAKRGVLPPKNSRFFIHLVMEQEPVPGSEIGLCTTSLAPDGFPRAQIRWRITDRDRENFHKLAKLTVDSWNASELGLLATARLRPREKFLSEMEIGGGIFHPAGTTRFGRSMEQGVVDKECRVFGFSNLWAVATSNIPSIGGSSPSLMLMLYARLAARSILRECRASSTLRTEPN